MKIFFVSMAYCLWCARRAGAFVAISMSYKGLSNDKVHFEPTKCLSGGAAMTSPTKAPPHLRTSRGAPGLHQASDERRLLQMVLWPFQVLSSIETRDQFLRPLPSEGRGHTFESCRVRQFFLIFQRDMRARAETPALRHSSE